MTAGAVSSVGIAPIKLLPHILMIRLVITFFALISLAFQTVGYNTTPGEAVLTETHLGELNLVDLSSENLKQAVNSAFPKLSLVKKSGRQDGPDFNYYSVSNAEEEDIFFISMDGNDSTRVQTVWIMNQDIQDQYEVQVLQKTDDLLKKRPNLKFHSNSHYTIYASESDSHIEYRLSGDFKALNDSVFTADDYSVEKWQVENMYVELIQWRK